MIIIYLFIQFKIVYNFKLFLHFLARQNKKDWISQSHMTGSWQGHAGFGQGTQKLEVCGGKWQGTPWRDIPDCGDKSDNNILIFLNEFLLHKVSYMRKIFSHTE